MSTTPTLTTHVFRVFGGDAANPECHDVASIGRDIQRTETLFAERGWGKSADRPMTAATAVCYFAMLRTGLFAGTWPDFEKWYLSVEPEEKVTAVPTDAGPESA